MTLPAMTTRGVARILLVLISGLLAALVVPAGAIAATDDAYPPPIEEVVEEDVVLEEGAEVRGVTLEQPPPPARALPVTGGQLALLVALGLALVVLGAAAVRATRRRSASARLDHP